MGQGFEIKPQRTLLQDRYRGAQNRQPLSYLSGNDVTLERFDQDRYDGLPRVRYVICAMPGSGGSLLCRQLIRAGLGVPHEYFHPLCARQLGDRWGLDLSTQGTVPYIRALFARRTTANGVWGLKLAWWHFEKNRQAVRHLLEYTPRFAFLYRQDTAAQAEALRAEQERWRRFFDNRSIQPFCLSLEELVQDQTAAVSRLAGFLDLTADEYTPCPPEEKAHGCPPHLQIQRQSLLQRLKGP